MANWFVTPAGGGNGTSWSTPWSSNSVLWGGTGVQPGDTVWIAGGTYTTGLAPVTMSGTSTAPVTVSAVLSSDAVATGTGWTSAYDVTSNRIVMPSTGIDVPNSQSYLTFNGRINDGWQINIPTSGGDGVDLGEGNGGGGQQMVSINLYYITCIGAYPTGPSGSMHGFAMSFNNSSCINCLLHGCSARGTNENVRAHAWNGVIIEYGFYADTIFTGGEHDDMMYTYPTQTNCIWRYNVITNSFADGFFFDGGPENASGWYFYGNLVYNFRGAWCIVTKIDATIGNSAGPMYIYNNTFYNDPGINNSPRNRLSFNGAPIIGTSYVYNNIFWNIANAFVSDGFTGTGTVVSDYNAYNTGNVNTGEPNSVTLTSVPWTSSPANLQPKGAVTLPWATAWNNVPAGGDFSLTLQGLIALGGGLSTLPNPAGVTGLGVDIDGNPRGNSGPWIMGAYDARPVNVSPSITLPAGYQLVFADEFNGQLNVATDVGWGPIVNTRAPYMLPQCRAGWIAHTPGSVDFGSSYFTGPQEPNGSGTGKVPPSPSLSSNGILSFTLYHDTYINHDRSGLLASVDTFGKGFTVVGGYFEIRCQMPGSAGVWPAFWLNSSNSITTPRRTTNSCEIDIFEFYGVDMTKWHQTVHVWSPSGGDHGPGANTVTVVAPTTALHTFSCWIKPDFIHFYMDGVEMGTPITTVFEATLPMYVLLNLGSGGGWPVNEAALPQSMLVDYVRVWAPSVGQFAPVSVNIGGKCTVKTIPPGSPVLIQTQPFALSNVANNSMSFQIASPQTAGNANVFVLTLQPVSATATVPTAFVDSNSNTYTLLTSVSGALNTIFCWYVCYNIRGGANTVNITFAQTVKYLWGIFAEYGPAFTALDQINHAIGSGTAISSGPITATNQAELVLGYCLAIGSASPFALTVGSGWNIVYQYPAVDSGLAYTYATAGVQYTSTWTMSGSQNWIAAVAAFSMSGGGNPTFVDATVLIHG